MINHDIPVAFPIKIKIKIKGKMITNKPPSENI